MKKFLIFFLCSLLTLVACQSEQTTTEVPLGLMAPLSGDLAEPTGQPTLNAAELAIEEVNEAGGIEVNGQKYPIKLVVGDDEDNPEQAVAIAKKLINQDQVVALVGIPLSRMAIPVSNVAEEAGIPMVSSKSTNPETTLNKKYVFRATFTDTFQGQVLAKFAQGQLNAKKAAVLYDVASDYNKFLAEVFKSSFEEIGGEVVAFESYVTGETDFTPQLKRIQKTEPDILFLPNYSKEVTAQTQQSLDLEMDTIFLGADAWSGLEDIKNPTLKEAYYTADWSIDVKNDQSADFVAAYEEMYDEQPSSAAALSYDAVKLVLNAIAQEQALTPEAIRKGLANTRNYSGVTGTISYDGSGDPTKSAVIFRMKDQKGVFDRMIEP